MGPEHISFPVEYPIKVIGRVLPGLRERIDEVFTRHFGVLHPHRVSERTSAQSSFVSFTYLIEVQAAAQLKPLHEELRALDGVIMVL